VTIRARLRERRTLENPNIPLSSSNIVTYLGGGVRTLAGVDISEDSALRNMAVWRAVNLVAGTIAGFSIRTYRPRPGPPTPRGEREEIDVPLFQGEAYPDLSWFEWKEQTLGHLLLWGNSYSLKIRTEGGDRVVRLLPIEPARVSVKRGPSSAVNPSGKTFTITGMNLEPLTPAEVLHIPAFGYDGIRGLSPIQYARNAIGVGIAAEEVAAKMFDSGLLNAGYIQAETELTDEQAEQIKQRWRDKIAGVVRSYEVAVLANGLKYTPATIPPKDAQWLEARQFAVEEIARLYGVPADLLMDNSATGNTNVEDRATAFVKFGLQPWVDRLEDRMSHQLCPAGVIVEMDMENLLRGDSAVRSQNTANAVAAVGTLIRSGYDPAESLAAMGLPPITHLGLLPVTLQKEEVFEADAEAAKQEAEDPPAEDPAEDQTGEGEVSGGAADAVA
jgi:HK97 family phage portal protein